MTPEKAIEVIREFMTNPYGPRSDYFSWNLTDAFELAIEALEKMEKSNER